MMSVLTVKTRHQESVTEWETHPTQHRIIIKECGCKLVTLRLKTKIYKYNLCRVGVESDQVGKNLHGAGVLG